LSGIAEILGEADKITDITVAIDKFEKIGLENVNRELAQKGIAESSIAKLQPIIELSGTNNEKLQKLSEYLNSSVFGCKGIEEMQTIFAYIDEVKIQTPVVLDLTLARGLNYYTGAIFEVKARDVEMGSICGGGRYDNLTGIFGLPDVSGVGISFGADRIYDVLNQLNQYPASTTAATTVMFTNFGEKEERYCLHLLQALRQAGIRAEIYPEAAKMKKQMAYADAKKIPFVALIGENEIAENAITLKDMQKGEQLKLSLDELIRKVS